MAEAELGAEAIPTVIASHIDIVYRIIGGGRYGTPAGQGESPWLRRVLRRQPSTHAGREVHAVKDVSFVAHHGESIGIIGRNGSGKSTLLRAVAGLIPPTNGQLWVSGEPSLLGVSSVLMSQLSGERNIYIGGQALGLTRQQVRERFDDIVDFSGIGDAVYRPMKTYSSGMGARLRFAISTSAAPDVLMIDEALATGDADFRERSAARIAEIRQSAGTVFLVSHSNSNIRQICDRVLWMDQGRLVMDGPTEEVVSAYEETLPRRRRARAEAMAEPDVPGVERVGDNSPANTAAAVSARVSPQGVEGVLLVPSRGASALRTVLPIAARLGWPILLTLKGSVPAATRDEIARLQPRRVVVVGSTDTVDAQVLDQLGKHTDAEVVRADARSSGDLAETLVAELPPGDMIDTIRVVADEPDPTHTWHSVQAALDGELLVVVDERGLSTGAVDRLRTLRPSRVVVAGPVETAPPGLLEQLRTLATVEHDERRGPMTMAVERTSSTTPPVDHLWISRMNATAEAVVASAAALRTREPVLFLPHDVIPPPVADELTRLAPRSITVVGGPDRVTPELRGELADFRTPAADEPAEPGSGHEPSDAQPSRDGQTDPVRP